MIPLVTGLIGLTVAILIIALVRKDRLHVRHGLGWLGVAGGFALLGLLPGLFDRLAIYFGIAYPPVLALTIGIVILVIKILLMDIDRSHLEMRNQRLVQRIAMFEAELTEMKNKQNLPSASDMAEHPKEKKTNTLN